jgi:peptidoglycan hydrolase-like protein with peptidoglycan-binding domain
MSSDAGLGEKMIYELPSSVTVIVNGTQETIPCYFTEESIPVDYVGHCAIPSENLNTPLWCNTDYSGMPVPGNIAPGSARAMPAPPPAGMAPGAIQVVKTPMNVNADTYVASYGQAYFDETGQYPPTGPWFLLAMFIIVILALLQWHQQEMNRDVQLAAIDASMTIQTVPADPDDPTSPWVMNCIGTTCTYLNKDTGQTVVGPQGIDLTKFIPAVTDYLGLIVYGAIGIAAAYVGLVYILPAVMKAGKKKET